MQETNECVRATSAWRRSANTRRKRARASANTQARAHTVKTRHTSSSHLLLCMCRLTPQLAPLHLYFGGFVFVRYITASCTNYPPHPTPHPPPDPHPCC